MRHIVPFLNEATRQAAREASEAARADRARLAAARMAGGPGGSDGGGGASEGPPAGPPAQAAPSTHPRSTHATAPSTPTKPAAVPPAGHGEASTAAVAAAAPAVAWAVSTRNLRTRFESEQMLAALRDVAYRGGHGSELKLEVLPAGEDWRAVGWPFATKAEAERLRAALAARGLKAEVVQF
jgi:cell division protein FtsN